MALTPMQQKIIEAKHPMRGRMLAFLKKHGETFVSATVVGNNAVNVLFSVACTQYAENMFGGSDVVVAFTTVAIIILMLMIGEIPPKQLGLRYSAWYANTFVFSFIGTFFVLWPAARAFSFFSMVVSAVFLRGKNPAGVESLSKEHLEALLSQMRFADSIPQENTRRVMRALTLADVEVENVMTRRQDVFSFAVGETVGEAAHKLTDSFYAVIPVYENGNVEQIVGVVKATKVFAALTQGKSADMIRTIMSAAPVLQESHSLDHALDVFERRGSDFSVVLDEYGGLAGVVTLWDIADYVFGLQQHGDDEESQAKTDERLITKGPNDEVFLIDGAAELSDIEDIAHVTITPRPESHTIGGYLAEYTGGGYIVKTQDGRGESSAKTIAHEKLGVFTILKEKNGLIALLRWEKPPSKERT